LSEIRATTISDAAGTGPITLTKQSAAKVWCDLNHTTNTINDSFNVSSMTDVTGGVPRINYSSSMASSYYSASALSIASGVSYTVSILNSHTSTYSDYVSLYNTNMGSALDATSHLMTVNGDLA